MARILDDEAKDILYKKCKKTKSKEWLMFTESYNVKYSRKKGDLIERAEVRFYAAGKNKHKEVEAYFKKNFNYVEIFSVNYE